MTFDRHTRVLIVGLGLMGASYAQALSQKGFTVGGIDCSVDSVALCLDKGWIADGRASVDPAFIGTYDLVVFALYPHILIEWLDGGMAHLKRGALLTDVTGVKGDLVTRVQDMLSERRPDLEFIGAHPMAGRESSGAAAADSAIFAGANYIVTPTGRNTKEAVEACRQLGETLGCARISELSPSKHDEMIAFLSQLTHCIAVSLMTCRDTKSLASYSGDSFRDLTRIARINDVMWSELFRLNKKELLKQMRLFETAFHRLYDLIESDDTDAIRAMMRFSTEQRKAFDKPTTTDRKG